jgi:type IV pilus assembly protein PilO
MTVMLDSKTASTQRMTARTRKLLNLKNIHFAGVAALALVCLYLLAQMAYAWRSARSQDAAAVAQQTAAMHYGETPVLDETSPSGALTKVQMDASLTGDYRPLVLFINGLERDKMFFVISAMALTGQQSGTVGVRLRITTYLRVPMDTDSISGVVGDPNSDSDASPQGGAAR